MDYSGKISGGLEVVNDLVSVAHWVIDKVTPLVTIKNLMILGLIWFLVWYWMKGEEEKANKYKGRLPFK